MSDAPTPTGNEFDDLIKNILDGDETRPVFGTGEAIESELMQYINSQDGTVPVISTDVPTRKEAEERSISPKRSQNDVVYEIMAEGDREQVYYKTAENVHEKTIAVNREKNTNGTIKDDLAVYNIDNSLIREVQQGVVSRVADVFKDFTPFKHDAEKTSIVKNQIEVMIKSSNNIKVPATPANVSAIYDEIMGLGPLSLLTSLPDVTEIMVDDYDNIYVEMEGILRRVENVKFKDRAHLAAVVERMVGLMGQSISFEQPILDMSLSDGSRVNVVGPPITEADNLYLLTIRRFRDTRFTLNDLLKLDTISAEMYQYLSNIMKARANVLLCGGTGSGKTATLEALTMEKDPNECIITVEDTRELMLKNPNWRPMKSKKSGDDDHANRDIDIRKLVKSALRMRPDSIIVGETRDATAYDILFAMNSGHEGCATTVHANSTAQALGKFEMLAKLAKDEAPPTDALREIIVDCFDVVIHIGRTPEGYRKMMSIDEVTGYDEVGHHYTLNNVFKCIQVNVDPNSPADYRFIPAPGYYTTETLGFKLKRWGMPIVQSPTEEKNNKKKLALAGAVSPWAEIEKQSEKARIDAQREIEKEKIRALRLAQKEAAKVRRIQNKERVRMENVASQELAKEQEKAKKRQLKEKQALERQLRIIAEKKARQEEARRNREKGKVIRDMELQQQRSHREQMQTSLAENYNETWRKEYDRLVKENTEVEEAKRMATMAAIAVRLDMESTMRDFTVWEHRNLPRALRYQQMINIEALSPEEISAQEGVSVNNILKYLNIVEPAFVKQYRAFVSKVKNRVPHPDDSLSSVEPQLEFATLDAESSMPTADDPSKSIEVSLSPVESRTPLPPEPEISVPKQPSEGAKKRTALTLKNVKSRKNYDLSDDDFGGIA
jgi:pilus assembly protein CpaF